MKTVFSNAMVAHVYAQQSQYEGRSNNGNFWFEGCAIFSYRTCMGVTHVIGGQRYFFGNRETYSITTSSKHNIGAYDFPGTAIGIPVYNHGSKRSHEILDKLRYAYETSKHTEYNPSKQDRRKAEQDAGVHIVKGLIAKAILYTAKAKRARTNKAWFESQALDTVNNAHKVRELLKIKSLVSIPVDLNAELKIKREKQREKDQARDLEKFEAWVQGEGGYYNCPQSYRTAPDGSVYMRIKDERLETSQGANVPLEQALKAFKMVKYCVSKGIDWKRNGERLPVGHFQIDIIRKNGDMVAGCYKFTYERMQEVAKANDLVDVLAENTAHV